MEHALVRRDVRMLHDPMRSQSRALAVGAILACLGLAGCAVLALLRPQDKVGDNKIIVGKDSGSMFVVLGDAVHPVMNLASARLAVGDPAKPAIVKETELGKRPRGALVGIPGAPSALPYDPNGTGRAWSVCDSIGSGGTQSLTNSVIVGTPKLSDSVSELSGGQALLLKGKDATYLVYDGKRAKVDLNDHAVTDALSLNGATPRPVSPGLLNAIPEVPEIKPPVIDGAKGTPSYPIAGQKIGAVVQVKGPKPQYFVVLKDGLQAISATTMELIRAHDSQNQLEITAIAPDARTDAPVSDALQVSSFPQNTPAVVDADKNPVSCLSWKPISGSEDDKSSTGISAELRILTGHTLPVPSDAKMVTLAQADGSGDATDNAYIHPGDGAFVQTTGIEPNSQRKDSTFFIADTGVRYGVPDADAAKALGFAKAEPAPWQLVSLLAPGPTLSREDAMVAHDGVAPDQDPASLPAAASSPK